MNNEGIKNNDATTTQQVVVEGHKREFGLLSMIAMVMGIVIGSGIFAKNALLVTLNGSMYITFAAWVVGALLVLAIVVAFMELFTITEKIDEQATYANWTRMLVNPTFAKIAGIYFVFISLPVAIVTMTCFAGNRIVDVVFVSWMGIDVLWAYFLIRIIVVLALLTYFFLVNGFYTKPGKWLSNVGTIVKIVPLAFVFILFVVMTLVDINVLNPIFNKDFNNAITDSWVNAGWGTSNKGVSGMLVFAATMPSIIFVFDGFLTSGSLSKEAKTPTTYRSAVLIGIIAITFIYFTYSLGVFSLGNPFALVEDGTITELYSWSEYQTLSESQLENVILNPGYGEINNSILSVWENAGWLADIITLTVALSIVTSVSSIVMAGMRGIADMSANNLIPDPEGKAIIWNKGNSLPGSMKMIAMMCAGYFLFNTALDIIAIPSDLWTTNQGHYMTVASDFFSSITSLGSFTIMGILLGAGIVNRFTNKVESDKFKLFIPAAVIAIITLTIVIAIFSMYLFSFNPGAEYGTTDYWNYVRRYIVQIVVAIAWIGSTPIWFYILRWRESKVTPEQLENKDKLIIEYKK